MRHWRGFLLGKVPMNRRIEEEEGGGRREEGEQIDGSPSKNPTTCKWKVSVGMRRRDFGCDDRIDAYGNGNGNSFLGFFCIHYCKLSVCSISVKWTHSKFTSFHVIFLVVFYCSSIIMKNLEWGV